jgi:hypothetical protein
MTHTSPFFNSERSKNNMIYSILPLLKRKNTFSQGMKFFGTVFEMGYESFI